MGLAQSHEGAMDAKVKASHGVQGGSGADSWLWINALCSAAVSSQYGLRNQRMGLSSQHTGNRDWLIVPRSRSVFHLRLPAFLFAAWFFLLALVGMNASALDVSVTDFGAVGDGRTLNTAQIQKAMDACSEKGGGTLRIPAGVFKAGTLHLKSNVTLHLEAGATLLQSRDLNDFAPTAKECYVHCTGSKHVFLHGRNVSNVSIVGEGRIDGNKGDMVTGRDARGPLSVLFENSSNIVMKDVTVENSPGWSVTFYGCKGVKVTKVKCLNSFADGINPSCCQDVVYDGVMIDGSGDDAITIKNESPVYPPPCEYLTKDIIVRNTTVRNTTHPAVKLGTGTFGVFRNITVENCTFENVDTAFAIQLMRAGRDKDAERAIEQIALSNTQVNKVNRAFDITAMDVSKPVMRMISVENFTAEEVSEPSFIYGLSDSPIRNVTFTNVKIGFAAQSSQPFWMKMRHVDGVTMKNVEVRLPKGMKAGLVCEDVKNLQLDAVKMQGAIQGGPAIQLTRVNGATIRKCTAPEVGTFLFAEGDRTGGIGLEENDFKTAQTPFDAAQDVPTSAVVTLAKNIRYSDLQVSGRIKANEGFAVDVRVRNEGPSGAVNVEASVDGKVSGTKWIWLKESETRKVSLLTRSYYLPEAHTITAGGLSATGNVEPAPAAFHFGEKLKITSPAAAGEITSVTLVLKNIGGHAGTQNVELLADGKAVASKQVRLEPGEEKEVAIEHKFADAGPHRIQVGDFPIWPYATYTNTKANFFLARDGRIIVESGGGAANDIKDANREYAAVYWKGVSGDFAASAKLLHQTVTGRYSGAGLIVKNDIAKPKESTGLVLSWHPPKYDVAGAESPFNFAIEKKGGVFSKASQLISAKDASPTQDVGIFVTAYSEKGELCRAEFQLFKVDTTAVKAPRNKSKPAGNPWKLVLLGLAPLLLLTIFIVRRKSQ